MSATITYRDIVFIIALTVFVLGVFSVIAGFFVLLSRAVGRGVRDIADQTKLMVSKGLADDLAGLVGNATALLSALDSLVRTTSGIGIFLIAAGGGMIAASWKLFNQIDWL
jgi:hypothetical protein